MKKSPKIEATKGVRDALTKRTALVTEVESIAAAQIAEVEAEIKVEKERIIETEQRLQADALAPAEAQCQRAIAEAKGQAAAIIEDGNAQALGLQRLGEVWQSAGEDAREVFLYQKIEVLMQMMAASVPKIAVADVTVVDADNGAQATKIANFLDQLAQTTGVDVKQILGRIASSQPTISATTQSSEKMPSQEIV